MQQNKLKKKWVLLIPLCFLILCVVMSWWFTARHRQSGQTALRNQDAFNTKLPDASLKETQKNKLEIYMQAQADSAKLKEALMKDSSQRRWFDPGPPSKPQDIYADQYPPTGDKNMNGSLPKTFIDANEKKVNQRLEKLYAALDQGRNNPQQDSPPTSTILNPPQNDQDIAHLENMLMQVENEKTDSSSDMKHIEAMLDKLLDIQHPERVNERLKQKSADSEKTFFAVSKQERFRQEPADDSIANWGNGFWGLQEETVLPDSENLSTIPAIVYTDQVVENNSTINLHLLQDIYIKGHLIPKSNSITGVCHLSNDRVLVQIDDVTCNNVIYPVSLNVYDNDGIEGIRIRGNTGYDMTKSELNQAIENVQLYNLNPSVAAQATSSGIQTIKHLITQNGKKAHATIKAGHFVLLKAKGLN